MSEDRPRNSQLPLPACPALATALLDQPAVPADPGDETEYADSASAGEFAPSQDRPLSKNSIVAEADRARGYPISRWYVRPLAGRLAGMLAPTRVRPIHVTFCGLLLSMAAVVTLTARPALTPLAAALVLAGWFCDRLDGQLARRQGTVTRWGGWLDGNVDELGDLALHTATACVAARASTSSLPWFLLIAFLAGKYLFVYGLNLEEQLDRAGSLAGTSTHGLGRFGAGSGPASGRSWLRTLWHLPGNADVRLHLLIVALLSGWLTAELAVVAAYYNLRWIAAYLLVARRLKGKQ